ncbi:MFS sugar transporter-like protein [Rhizodiscina lignyota]|uniref:MFS sugar transporter-like protein n=1 Tax=Rhizodiscina lignyota TaxID=1504668 RepID=A0A9P4IIJ5_9PEZI|nr:MFS sugar transporter-like protein [Rhizodiscina lignyota]
MTVTNVYLICGFAAIGGGLFGLDISSMSGVLGTQAYIRYFNNPLSYRQGGITASMPAGSFAGALASSFLADKYSRKVTIQIASVIWIIGAILQTASQNVGMLCAGRVIAGLSIGIASSVVPIYQAEIAPKEIRGRIISMQQWAITWGILIQFFIQYGASFIDGGPKNPTQSTAAFRIPWGLQMIPAFILLIGLIWFPKSPRWLASKDRWDDAVRVLADLHGKGDTSHPKVLAELQEIREVIEFERQQSTTSYQQLLEPKMARRVFLGMSVQMWSQLSGMNVLMYYIVYVMQGAGITNPLLPSSIQYVINTVLTLPAILFVDRWGRRPTLLAGAFMMMTCLFISGSIQGAYGQPAPPGSANTWQLINKPAQGKAVIAVSYIFVAAFATSWGPISWTYPAEIYPSRIRAKAVSLATASCWAWNTALAFAVPPLLSSINWKMYMIFGAFNGAAFIHMFLTAPETKGRTLEEMDEVFDTGIPAWRSNKALGGSRLDELERQIEEKQVTVEIPVVVGKEDKV